MFILPMKAEINSSRGEEELGKVPQRFQPMSRIFFFFLNQDLSRGENKRQCAAHRKAKEREDKTDMKKDR